MTGWIHTLECQHDVQPPDALELENLQNFRELLVEVERDYDRDSSLAAEIAEVWATFLDEAWVWAGTLESNAHYGCSILADRDSRQLPREWRQS